LKNMFKFVFLLNQLKILVSLDILIVILSLQICDFVN